MSVEHLLEFIFLLFQFPFRLLIVRPCNYGKAWSFLYPPPRSVFFLSRERGGSERLQPLDVPVLLPQYGHLVFKQDRVQPHLRVDQGHRAKPAGKLVHAGLTLGKMVRVGPARCPGALEVSGGFVCCRERERGREKDREQEKKISINYSNLLEPFVIIKWFI